MNRREAVPTCLGPAPNSGAWQLAGRGVSVCVISSVTISYRNPFVADALVGCAQKLVHPLAQTQMSVASRSSCSSRATAHRRPPSLAPSLAGSLASAPSYRSAPSLAAPASRPPSAASSRSSRSGGRQQHNYRYAPPPTPPEYYSRQASPPFRGVSVEARMQRAVDEFFSRYDERVRSD